MTRLDVFMAGVVLAALPVTAPAQFEILEDFETAVNPALFEFYKYDTGGDIWLEDGHLRLFAEPEHGRMVALQSRFQLVGDFDLIVDYELVDAPLPTVPGSANSACLIVGDYAELQRNNQVAITPSGFWHSWWEPGGGSCPTLLATPTGSLRFERTGTALTAYFRAPGGEWQVFCTVTYTADPVPLRLVAYLMPNSDRYLDTAFDNLSIVADAAIGSDCNNNGIPDFQDLLDCDGSAWCTDCNNNGILDVCDGIMSPGTWTTFEPAHQGVGTNPIGYFGGVHAGDYVYFAPYRGNDGFHGEVLRYDVHGNFVSPSSWSTYDPGEEGAVTGDADGYRSPAFDGRYVYFSSYHNGDSYHGLIMRYDITIGFQDQAAWTTFDVQSSPVNARGGYFDSAYDGRFVYFVGGMNANGHHAEMLRLDTLGGFDDAGSWATFDPSAHGIIDSDASYSGAVVAAEHVYFAPYRKTSGSSFGTFLRYDVTASFADPDSWDAFDPGAAGIGVFARGFSGGTSCGRYLYFVSYYDKPNYTGEVLRYDTAGPFADTDSWEAFNPGGNHIGWAPYGYWGVVNDGRYLYFSPMRNDMDYHGEVLIHDTSGGFTDPLSWRTCDPDWRGVGSDPDGYFGAVYDGRFVYFVPFYNGTGYHGEVLRYDTQFPWDGDCNGNEIPDECDIASGFSTDINSNGIPDECEGPTYAEQLWATVNNTDADLGPVGDYELWVQSNEPLTGLTDRPLAETTDAALLESIYAVGPDSQVVTEHTVVDKLVILAQSARKVPGVSLTMREALVHDHDVKDFHLEIWPIIDGPWIQAPDATPDWWVNTFVSQGYFVPPAYWTTGVLWEGHRADMYAEIVLDAIMQPDFADQQADDPRLMARLSEVMGLAEIVPEDVREVVLRADGPPELVVTSHFEDMLDAVSSATGSTLIGGLTGIAAISNQFGGIYSDMIRNLLLKALADTEAEQRLTALEWAIGQIPGEDVDPALLEGLQNARDQWNFLVSDWYGENGRATALAAAAANQGVLDWAHFAAQMVSSFSSLQVVINGATVSVGRVILPYTLSWSANQGIREQAYEAQRCCLAATLQRALFIPEILPELQNRLDGQDPIDDAGARNAAHLLQMNAYLSFYFYDRYLSISSNTWSYLMGNMWNVLLPGKPYDEFIEDLMLYRQEARNEVLLLCGPKYLTTHAVPTEPSFTDQEYEWLLSLTRTEPLDPNAPGNPALDATFTWFPEEVERGEPVTFTPAQGGLTSYAWTFGDGETSSGESPTHTYTYYGTFSVSLTVGDSLGNEKTHVIRLDVSEPPPAASFIVDTPQIAAGETASFTNASSGTVTGYLWSFGDGGASTGTNPMHYYANPGDYVVTLTAYGPDGQDTHVVAGAVQVSGASGTVDVTSDLGEGSFLVSGPNGLVISGSDVANSYTNQPAGEYTITWTPQQGYETPASETLTLDNGQTIAFAGSYIELPEPDTTPPTVTQTLPMEGAYLASLTEIVITFSEQVRLSPSDVVVEDQDGIGYVAGAFDVSAGTGGETIVTLTYSASPPHGEYLIRIRDVVLDMQNNQLDGDGDGQAGGDFELHVWRLAGDLDANGVVDAVDFARFAECIAGPGITTPPPGADPEDFVNADLDYDGDVDLRDFAEFQRAFTGQ